MSMAHHTTTAGEPLEKHALFRITHSNGYQQRIDMHFGDATTDYTDGVFDAAVANGRQLYPASPVTEAKLISISSRLPGEGFTEPEPEGGMPG